MSTIDINELRATVAKDLEAARQSAKLLRVAAQRQRAEAAARGLEALLCDIDEARPEHRNYERDMRSISHEAGSFAQSFIRPERIAEIDAYHAERQRLQNLREQLRADDDPDVAEEHDRVARTLYGDKALTWEQLARPKAKYERASQAFRTLERSNAC